jgi:hypothetical protein
MDHLTKDTIQTIERLHSTWIDLEVAGKAHGLLAFCAQDIELRPPDGPSVYGRDAVLAHLVEGTAQIHSIEIPHRLHLYLSLATLRAQHLHDRLDKSTT